MAWILINTTKNNVTDRELVFFISYFQTNLKYSYSNILSIIVCIEIVSNNLNNFQNIIYYFQMWNQRHRYLLKSTRRAEPIVVRWVFPLDRFQNCNLDYKCHLSSTYLINSCFFFLLPYYKILLLQLSIRYKNSMK